MADLIHLEGEKFRALQDAVQTIEALLGASSDRLYSAQHDVVGRNMDSYVSAMALAELTRVVAAQQERVAELEKAASKK